MSANLKVLQPAEDSPAERGLAVVGAAPESASDLARRVGYEGELTVEVLEREIRFYQRRTVDACLELGKRLLMLKELAPHGSFGERVDALGFSKQTASRFMQAAAKTAKSPKLGHLSNQVKNMSAFLELVTHDEDTLQAISELDEIDCMSASQLRAFARASRDSARRARQHLKVVKADVRRRIIADRLVEGGAPLRAGHDGTYTDKTRSLRKQALVDQQYAACGIASLMHMADLSLDDLQGVDGAAPLEFVGFALHAVAAQACAAVAQLRQQCEAAGVQLPLHPEIAHWLSADESAHWQAQWDVMRTALVTDPVASLGKPPKPARRGRPPKKYKE